MKTMRVGRLPAAAHGAAAAQRGQAGQKMGSHGGQHPRRGESRIGGSPRRPPCDHRAVIERYTRPEIGAVWTDEARMEAWRRVEVAAAEELEDGPTRRRARGDPRRDLHRRRRCRSASEITDHDVAAFVDVLAASAGDGRPLDPLRPDVQRRARHRARPAAPRCRRRSSSAAPASSPTRSPTQARAHVRHRLRRPHARRPRRADDVRHQARRLRDARRTATPSACERAFDAGGRRRAVAAPSARTPRSARTSSGACSSALGLRARAGLDAGRAARPPRRAAAGDRARRRRARALRHRDPPPPAHRGARGRGAVPRRAAEGLERDAAQAQPDHDRAHHRPGARPARLRPGGRRERRAVARARHLALRRRAGDPARRDDPARLHAGARHAGRARDGRARRPHAGQPRR